MPDFAPDYTFRYKVRYLAAGLTHDFTVRGGIIYSGGESLAGDLANAVGQYFAAIQASLYADFEFLNASWAYADSNTFVPTDALPAQPTPGAVTPLTRSKVKRATACNHAGRSTALGSARLYYFGVVVADNEVGDAGSDGVLTAAELTGLATATDVANASFRSSDGSIAEYYTRLTCKVNDRALRLVRRTGP